MNNFVKTYIMRQVDTVRVSEISNIMPQRRVSIINCTFNTSSNKYIPTITIIHRAHKTLSTEL